VIYSVGHEWTNRDFTTLGWNASRLYGWILPGREHKFLLHIDYCLKTPITDQAIGKYEIVPVELIFEDVVGLKINIDLDNYTELDITHIERTNKRSSPNGKLTYWDFHVSLSVGGEISFTSTGFTQTTLSNPIITEGFDLDREIKLLGRRGEYGSD